MYLRCPQWTEKNIGEPSAIADPVDGVDEKTPHYKGKTFVLAILDFSDRV
jgi:hypothetical protein